jgi:biopolymer transport protein ExbB
MLIRATAARAQDAAGGAAPAPAATTQESAPAAKAAHNPSAFELFQLAGFFMYPLALCSIISVAIIIERFAALRRSQVNPLGFMAGLREVCKELPTDREAGIAYCKRSKAPIARMVEAGLKRLPRGLMAAEKAIEDAGGNEALKLRRNMRFLYALGSVATLLGLIGTISGMIKAFQVAASAGIGRVDQLSTGIYEAMVNTFGGLAVAIVVTVFYYFFVGRIERLIADINDTLARFSDDYGFNAESTEELSVTSTL